MSSARGCFCAQNSSVDDVLVLVRHGESELNRRNCLVGRLDPELTDRGEEQARQAGKTLGPVTTLISSPLSRTRRTAELLGLGVPLHIDERVIEIDYGDLDGTPLDAIDPKLWEQWFRDPDFAPANGESLATLSQRVTPLLEELFASPGEGARSREGDVVIVSHVSPIKAAVAWALGTDPLLAWRLRLSTGSITRIAYGPQGPQLTGFNELPGE